MSENKYNQIYLKRLHALAEVDLLKYENFEQVDGILAKIVAVANNLVPSDMGVSIILWDAEKEAFTLSATTVANLSPENFSRDTRSSNGVTRWIVDNLESYVVENIEDDPFRKGRKMRDYGARSYLGVPLQQNHNPLGALFIFNKEPQKYSDNEILFCKLLASRAASAITYTNLLIELNRKATRDGLTGLLNRTTFFEVAEKICEEKRRYGEELSLLFMDVDNLKQINDTYGHQKGDHVLYLVAEIITSAIREMDVVARYGGDEFVMLFPGTSTDQLNKIKLRIIKLIKNTNWGIEEEKVVVSIGKFSSNSVYKITELIKQADNDMYREKANGKSQIND